MLYSDQSSKTATNTDVRSVEVCGITASGRLYDDTVNKWFSTFLGIQCALARRDDTLPPIPPSASASASGAKETKRTHTFAERKKLGIPAPAGDVTAEQRLAKWGFANEGQYLLVNESSVQRMVQISNEHHIRMRRADGMDELDVIGPTSSSSSTATPTSSGDPNDRINAERFRPNFVVTGGIPFQEDSWSRVMIGSMIFTVTGPCARCTMVNIDQTTGSRESNLFATLASARRNPSGKIVFGVLLGTDNDNTTSSSSLSSSSSTDAMDSPLFMRVGMTVTPTLTTECTVHHLLTPPPPSNCLK
jgi:uncharacterized protein YcbX